MGEAFTGLADDVNFLQYNIGALGFVDKASLGINYHNWIEDTQQGAFGFATSTDYGKFGFSFVYFNEGEITELDEEFSRTGSIIGSNDIALTMGVGYPKNIFGLNISFGGGFKIVRQNLADQSATALGMDLGFLVKHKHLSYGATVQNFSITKLKFIEKEDPLPETYRGGLGFKFNIKKVKVKLAADAAWMVHQKIRTYLGTEFIINNVIALRGGYKLHDFEANRWGAGAGVIIPMEGLRHSYAKLNYSYSPLTAFEGSAHRFSLLIEFDTMEKKPAEIFSEADRKRIDDLSQQLQSEVDAAKNAREAAEQSKQQIKKIQQEMERKLAYIDSIANSSNGKIVLQETSEADSNVVKFKAHINFDFDRANIRTDEFETMHQVGKILNAYPGNKVQLSGHTCFIGTEEYNIRLSHRRVDSVMSYLTKKEAIELDRYIYPIGYGKQKPVASNETSEGRAMNRRVEFKIYTTDDSPIVPEGSAIKYVAIHDDQTVKIICNGKVNYHDQFLTNPDRIVIDFPGIFLLTEKKAFKFSNNIFMRARLGYHHDEKYSRIVLDLKSPVQYQIVTKDNIIYVRAQ